MKPSTLNFTANVGLTPILVPVLLEIQYEWVIWGGTRISPAPDPNRPQWWELLNLPAEFGAALPEPVIKPPQDLLPEFLRLDTGTDADVKDFIRSWGALGINAVPCAWMGHERGFYREPIESYRVWARCAQAILSITADLQNGGIGKMSDWHALGARWWWTKQIRSIKNASDFPHSTLAPPVEEMLSPGLHDRGEQINRISKELSAWVKIETAIEFREHGTEPGLAFKSWAEMGNGLRNGFLDPSDQAVIRQYPTYERNNRHFLTMQSALLPIGVQLLAATDSPIPTCIQCGRRYPSVRKAREDDRAKPLCSEECRTKRRNEQAREGMRRKRALEAVNKIGGEVQ